MLSYLKLIIYIFGCLLQQMSKDTVEIHMRPVDKRPLSGKIRQMLTNPNVSVAKFAAVVVLLVAVELILKAAGSRVSILGMILVPAIV